MPKRKVELTEREREIIREHVGFALPVASIAAKYKITQQRVRQILKRAVDKLAGEPKPRPFILVTIHGGVATVWEHPGVDADVVDWDNWYDRDPTRDELKFLREVAEQLQDRNDRAEFLRQVQELEDRGVAEDEE